MYLGLDCSTLAVHAAVVNDKEELVSLHKWGSKEKKFDDRFPEIFTKFSEDLSKIKVIDSAAIAAAIFIQNPKSTIAIANVAGAVLGFLVTSKIPTVFIDNRHWKKFILEKGNASKEDIKKFAIEKWGDIFPEQDYADAACVALCNKRRS